MLNYNVTIKSKEELSIQEIDEILTELAKLCGDRYFTWDSPSPYNDHKISLCLHVIKSTLDQIVEKLPELYKEFPNIILYIE